MRRNRSDTELKPLDLVLSAIASGVAVVAGAISLASDHNAVFFGILIALGTAASVAVVHLLGHSRLMSFDAATYTVLALGAAFGIGTLNGFVPDALYDGNLTMAGVLSWMIVLGSFAIWRDQTMLFQAVPAVALFGLVGCYDTFRASVVYFFIFLVCQAILLSRAHGRAMLRQARSSSSESLEMAAMRDGPWRWMAGPEWALASALAIVLISAVGAPLLRDSASGFSGLVKYAAPMVPLAGPSVSAGYSGGVRVGTGPNVVRNTPVFRAELDEPLYLRGYSYGRYDRGAWLPRNPTTFRSLASDSVTPRTVILDSIADKQEYEFKVSPLVPSFIVPAPGEVTDLLGRAGDLYSNNRGGSFSSSMPSVMEPLNGKAVRTTGSVLPRDSEHRIEELITDYGQRDQLPPDVVELAQKVTAGKRTDFDKALAIQREIERRVLYNLNAAPTPAGLDPVSYFLFSSKQGYCDLFASAMTVMARAVGLPARYVTGYYPFESAADGSGPFVIRQKDAHAWCEILFKGVGWVVFDATEGARSVDGGELGSVNDKPLWANPWFLLTLGTIATGVLGTLSLGRAAAYLRFRRSSAFAVVLAARSAAMARRRLGREYLRFEREIRRVVRRPRRLGETVAEYVRSAGPRLGAKASKVGDVGAELAAAMYSKDSADAETTSRLRDRITAMKREIRNRAS